MGRCLIRLGCIVAIVVAIGGSLAVPAEAAELRIATFRCDITPPLGIRTYPSNQPLEVIEHPLLAKGIVIDDGGKRYVFCSMDWGALRNSTHDLYRRKIAEAAGTDSARVALHCIHQHTAPMVDIDAMKARAQSKDAPPQSDIAFFELAADWLAVAVKTSLVRLQPIDRIGSGEAKVDRVGSTRRLIDADGKVHTPRWSNRNPPEVRDREEGIIDPMLKTVTFAQGNKPLVRLHFYACHPQSFYNDPRVTCDFPGMAREELEKKEGVFQIYFTGCGGDILVGKYNDGTRAARDEFRGRMLRGMEAAIAATTLAPVQPIQWRTVDLKLPPLAPGDSPAAAERAKQSKAPARKPFDRALGLTSLQMGNIHILGLPGECLIEYQLFAQRSAPKEFVAVAAYADQGPGYICTDKAFDQGGYEPASTRVGRGTEALLKDAIVNLLGGK